MKELAKNYEQNHEAINERAEIALTRTKFSQLSEPYY
jgi:hypothetical protein